ncbi:M48 family metallopeptidase [Intrasporangium sp. YIM S08009]|uniref:M48 family metallopeptidase n=1 Tax=Intrasporangium zincisolvens TaxID=3080018 RepID=UPI002B05CEAE|nr:M48 family metallopeptidase [Intrasporangium sp. YIM S08009]
MSDLHPASPDAPAAATTTTAPTIPSASRPTREPWFTRRRREAVDRAAHAGHAELVRLVASGRAPATRTAQGTAVVAASVVVLGLVLAAVALLARATFADKGLWGWVLVALGWVVVAHVAPRPVRLEAEALDASTHPATHRLVSAVAEAVGTTAPRVVAVDGDLAAGVANVGWRMRPAVVVGLPLWTMLRPEQRLALLAHELGHLRGRDTFTAALVGQAHRVLERLATLLVPLPRGAFGELEWLSPTVGVSSAFGNRMGAALLRVVSLPFVALLLGFERLVSVDAQRREYLADLAAARVAGPAAVVRLLFTVSGLAGVHTTVAAAVRRGEDPFDALEAVAARPALGPGQLAAARRLAAESGRRWDDSHPRDDLRISLLEALPGTPSGVLTGRGSATATLAALEVAASAELAGLRRGLSRSVRDDLLESHL